MADSESALALLPRLEPGVIDGSIHGTLLSIAISMKRIADVLAGANGIALLEKLGAVLDDASHNHAHRMKP